MLTLMLELGDPRGEPFRFRVCEGRVDCHGCHSFARELGVRQARVDLQGMKTILLATVITIGLCGQSASQAAGSVAAGSVAPIGAYTVVPQLPGTGRPVDTAAVAARRRALLKRISSGTVLIAAGHERDIEPDYVQDHDFRQDNTFYYFTELETQDAVLLLTARGPDSLETVLFLPPRTPDRKSTRLNSSHPSISYAVFCLKKKKKKNKEY